MKKLFFVLTLFVGVNAFAGFATTYTGTADCGIQDWPRDNSMRPFGRNCHIRISVAPVGRDRWNRMTGDFDITIEDMRFSASYIQVGSTMYVDFPYKQYSGYRTVTIGRDRRGNQYLYVPAGRYSFYVYTR